MREKRVRVPVGRAVPGDTMFAREHGRMVELGVVAGVVKNVARRSVTVSFTDGSGFSQNWAAKVWVTREEG